MTLVSGKDYAEVHSFAARIFRNNLPTGIHTGDILTQSALQNGDKKYSTEYRPAAQALINSANSGGDVKV